MGADEIKNNNDDDGDGCCCGGGCCCCCCIHGSDCLHVPIDRRDIVAGEHARLAVAASFPPVGVRVVQDLDEVAASETQLSFLLGVEVKERLHVRGMLCDRERERGRRQVGKGVTHDDFINRNEEFKH